MARRPLRQLVREARQAERDRHARSDSYERWLSEGITSEPDEGTRQALLRFDQDTHRLSIEYEFPTFESTGQVAYRQLLAEMTLRCIRHCLNQDAINAIHSVLFRGFAEALDLATGREGRQCLVQVKVDRVAFEQLDLTRVDPIACLEGLGATIAPGYEGSSSTVG